MIADIHRRPIQERIGWLFDLAVAHTCAIKQQVEHIFGSGHGTVYPLVCGFETDEDALVVHGADGGQLDEHREWMICLGRGFDFLHTPNLALIIGPYSPNLDEPIHTAAAIEANMGAGRIPGDGFLLLASVPYDEIGVDRARAELKSRFLSRFAGDLIRKEFPGLAGKMTTRTAVLDWRSRALENIGEG